MTQKRYKKLLMAIGTSRNTADSAVKAFIGFHYFDEMRHMHMHQLQSYESLWLTTLYLMNTPVDKLPKLIMAEE